ncbi:MAG: MFS transporter, partial [Sinobacterium sp.]|nr:MFS transporter [Sinobacterium sp.]
MPRPCTLCKIAILHYNDNKQVISILPMPENTQTTVNNPAEKKENLWINLLFNIVAPALILSKLSGEDQLGSTVALVVALLFPLSYGLLDFKQRKKINVFSILGIISTLLTGTISLLALPPEYIAIKEAAIPGIIFFIVLISTRTSYPLVEKLIFNDAIFNLVKLKAVIEEQNNEAKLHQIMNNCSYLVAASFALSSVLNYILAIVIVVSPAG